MAGQQSSILINYSPAENSWAPRFSISEYYVKLHSLQYIFYNYLLYTANRQEVMTLITLYNGLCRTPYFVIVQQQLETPVF